MRKTVHSLCHWVRLGRGEGGGDELVTTHSVFFTDTLPRHTAALVLHCVTLQSLLLPAGAEGKIIQRDLV